MGGVLLYKKVPCYKSPIQLSSLNNWPIVNMDIGGRFFPVFLGLGTDSFLALQSDILERIEKYPDKMTDRINFNGRIDTLRSFVLPSIKIGKWKATEITVIEKAQQAEKARNLVQPVGEVGNRILEKTNLVLDFPHNRIWMIENLEGLREAGFNEKKMLKVPFELWKSGIILKVDTDRGRLRMLLSTNSTLTTIKSSLVKGETGIENEFGVQVYANTNFSIEGKNFGPFPVSSVVFPSEFDQFDAVLGMDFLSQHIIYIDYQNRAIYIGYAIKDICTALPVRYSSSKLPVIETVIGEKKRYLKLDTGANSQLNLNTHFLKSVKAKKSRPSTYTNIKNETFQTSSFLIPTFEFGELIFSPVEATEMKGEFSRSATLGKSHWTQDNYFGRFVLEKINLLLDFPHNKLWQIGSQEALERAGFDLNKMVKVPFELNEKGILIDVMTEMGKLRLSFDTGSTLTIVKPQSSEALFCKHENEHLPIYSCNKFQIGGHDFGQLNIYGWDVFPLEQNIDGVLGMNFIKDHIIYIDYPNKQLFINIHKTRS